MIPVDQDKFYVAGVSRGNCQQAAVASLLNLRLDQVPNFMEAEDFWTAVRDWAESKGYWYCQFDGEHFRVADAPTGYYLAYGRSPRGVMHAVVYESGRLVHDPHPSRAGIEKVETIALFVLKDPAMACACP